MKLLELQKNIQGKWADKLGLKLKLVIRQVKTKIRNYFTEGTKLHSESKAFPEILLSLIL